MHKTYSNLQLSTPPSIRLALVYTIFEIVLLHPATKVDSGGEPQGEEEHMQIVFYADQEPGEECYC